MSGSISVSGTTRSERYQSLMPQVIALLQGEADLVASMANLSAAIHAAFGFHWVGFYIVKGNDLVLGPFQGPVACTRIARGRGVCGSAWAQGRSLVVPDVDKFPGHIACSAASRSEVVVPVRNNAGEIVAVLDIDSDLPDDFHDTDRVFLEQMCALLENKI